jgi:Tol biopolymer transport system component
MAIRETQPDTKGDILAVALDGETDSLIIRDSPFDERFASFSPDGRFVAYESDDTGRIEVYVQPLYDPVCSPPTTTPAGPAVGMTSPLMANDSFSHESPRPRCREKSA